MSLTVTVKIAMRSQFFEIDSDEPPVYYEVVTKDGKYELVEEV